MIKTLLSKILPMPSRTSHEKFDLINARFDLINARFDPLQDSVKALEKHIAGNIEGLNNDMARRITDANRDINKQLDDSSHLLLTELQQFQGMWQENVLSHKEVATHYYMYNYIKRMRNLLQVMDVCDGEYCRIGRDYDGGYTMLNDFAKCRIAYSIGICDDVSWDKDMANLGMDVYMYDHTIEGLPESNDKVHWFKIGLAGIYREATPMLKTLPMLLEENGHSQTNNMVLKMDIEGAEWEVLANIDEAILKQFSQIAFEFHGLNNLAQESIITAALQKLNSVHQLVHVHGNNWEGYKMADGLVLPDALECTYLNKAQYDFKPSNKFFPLAIDQINNPWKPEIVLGKWS